MSKEGMQTIFPMEEIAVMGLWELLPHLNTFRVNSYYIFLIIYILPTKILIQRLDFILQKKLKETTEAVFLFRPHAVVTVDSKGFSFRLLEQLKGAYSQDVLHSLHKLK